MQKSLFSEPDGSSIYQSVKNDPRSSQFKQDLEALWKKFSPYASPDFLKNFRNDDGKFDSLLWEMQLGAKLLDKKFELIKNQSDDQPDLCVFHKGRRIWLECALPTRGNPCSEDYLEPHPVNGNVYFVDMDKNILRCTSVISTKMVQHQRWLKEKICEEHEPFIIAIHGKYLDIGMRDDFLPDVCRAVYPVGDFQARFTDPTSEITTGYTHQITIKKSNGSDVSKETFTNPENAHVTGILYAKGNSDILRAAYIPNVYATNEIDFPLNPFFQVCNVSLIDNEVRLELDS